ncbi:MAG: ABC transporter permease [Melioribacteraceae bacterium]|nr:ABC transporter permease [Melioribacteraceae bacterium]
MKNIVLLFRKDFIRFFADKPAVMLTFLVPAVLIVIFGSIFGGGSGSRGKIPIVVVNNSGSELAQYIETELDSSSSLRSVKYTSDEEGKEIKITHERAKELVQTGKFPAALVMPEDFFADTSSSLKFKYYYDPRNEIEAQLIQGTIQRTIFSNIPQLFPVLMQREAKSFLGDTKADSFQTDVASMLSDYFGIDEDEVKESMMDFDLDDLTNTDSSDSTEDVDVFNSLVKFDSEQLVGTEVKNPGVTRIVGGWAIMFLLFTLTGVASSIFEEKQEGTLKRVFCMPISRNQYLIAKYLFSIFIGVLQLAVLFIFAYFLYDVDIFSNISNLVIVIFISASAAVAFGMIIIAFSTSLAQANGISTLFILIMSALGGSWFPVTLFPDWMQIISKFTLTYWSVEAFLQVLWRNASLIDILFPYIVILLAIAVIVNILALYFFKKRQVV